LGKVRMQLGEETGNVEDNLEGFFLAILGFELRTSCC
jgi:hypothetical protein